MTLVMILVFKMTIEMIKVIMIILLLINLIRHLRITFGHLDFDFFVTVKYIAVMFGCYYKIALNIDGKISSYKRCYSILTVNYKVYGLAENFEFDAFNILLFFF